MENMKAVQVHNYGGPEVLRFEDAPRPTPASGELLIRVYAASVNAIDWKARAGYVKDYIPLPLPFIPGWDFSGIVEAVGSGVAKFKKGDEVHARPDGTRNGKGTHAEYVVVKETEAALKPKSIDHVHADAIPVVALTAWQALFDQAGLSKGQKILIHGAAGGVGSVAVQLNGRERMSSGQRRGIIRPFYANWELTSRSITKRPVSRTLFTMWT